MRTFTDKPLIMEHIKEKHADKGRICKVLIRKKPDEKSTPAIGNGTGNGERSQKPNKTHAPFAHTPMSLGITCKFCPKNPAFRNIQQLEVSWKFWIRSLDSSKRVSIVWIHQSQTLVTLEISSAENYFWLNFVCTRNTLSWNTRLAVWLKWQSARLSPSSLASFAVRFASGARNHPKPCAITSTNIPCLKLSKSL